MGEILGLVLAGGRGTRMGGVEKGLVTLGGKPLVAHVLARLAPQIDRIAINANRALDDYRAFGCPVLPDRVPGFAGPLAGILAGLEWAEREGAAAIVTTAADTPFLPRDLRVGLELASVAAETDLALAASPDGSGRVRRHPTFGLWPVRLRADLAAALEKGMRKIVVWTDSHGAATAVFDHGGDDPFFNINTPEDLALAESRLARRQDAKDETA